MTLTIELSGVSCHFDDEALFNEVTTKLVPGSLTRIGGPNGAGKTTLLRCLAGLSSAYVGNVSYHAADGESLNLDLALTSICYIGHKAGIKGHLSAVDNLDWLSNFQYPESLLLEALDSVGLYGFEYQPCNTLSAGQKRRVALAQLYLPPKPILILDEPFTALDVAAVAQFEQKLCALADTGTLVVFTTHHDIKLKQVHDLMLVSARGQL